MANQLNKGRAFLPGDTVNADDLNNLVDLAVALPPIVTDGSHPVVSALAGDKALLVRAGALKQADVNTFPHGVTSVGMTVVPTSVFSLTGTNPITATGSLDLGLKAQAPGTVLAGPVSGSNATPSFRVIAPDDIALQALTIAAYNIDLSTSNTFIKQVPDNGTHTFTFVAGTGVSGQTFKVWVQNFGSSIIHWAAGGGGLIRWPLGVEPPITVGGGRIDIFEFLCFGSNNFYGTVWGKDMQL